MNRQKEREITSDSILIQILRRNATPLKVQYENLLVLEGLWQGIIERIEIMNSLILELVEASNWMLPLNECHTRRFYAGVPKLGEYWMPSINKFIILSTRRD